MDVHALRHAGGKVCTCICTGMWVSGTGVWVSGTGVWKKEREREGYCLQVSGTGVWVSGTGVWVSGTGVWVSGTGVWVSGTGVWVSGTGVWKKEREREGYCLQVVGPGSLYSSCCSDVRLHLSQYVSIPTCFVCLIYRFLKASLL